MPPYQNNWPRFLSYGDSGPAVKWLQERLLAQGCFRGVPRGNFRGLTRNAVLYFQSTHLGRDGRPLEVDGAFGPNTLWAIRHPSGEDQRSRLEPLIPEGINGDRKRFLETVVADYRTGEFIEIPDGSNSGPRISAFSRGTYWCCFYQSDAWNRTFGTYPLGTDHGHCLTFWREAKRLGQAIPKTQGDPLPGDLGVMLYRNTSGNLTGSGHIFAIGGVSGTGRQFNTFGGNEGNRLKHGLREVRQSTIVGWIDLYGDDRERVARQFRRGIVSRPSASGGFQQTR